LIKDRDGLYECDPALNASPRRFQEITFAEALGLDGKMLQKKAIRFAQKHDFPFEVATLSKQGSTLVGTWRSALADECVFRRRLKVGLLGLGTVGLGVLQRLLSEPEKFHMTGVAVLDPIKNRDFPIPENVTLTNDAWEIIESDCDVVIEVIGGKTPAKDLVRAAIQQGKHVITANKLLLATSGESLYQEARRHAVNILYSAAAGGAVPMLEAVKRIAQEYELREIRGVLNGTCNFVLDRMAAGDGQESAVLLAQRNGFAEVDPTLDLDGSDAAQKLMLLAHAAFGVHVPFEDIAREGILDIKEDEVRRSSEEGHTVRLVASAARDGTALRCRVNREVLNSDHPFALVENEHNCLTLQTECGQVFTVRGRGAGRWPTTEAVFADALDLWRNQQSVTTRPEEAVSVGGAA
jgi:homoserine dehydrogenase